MAGRVRRTRREQPAAECQPCLIKSTARWTNTGVVGSMQSMQPNACIRLLLLAGVLTFAAQAAPNETGEQLAVSLPGLTAWWAPSSTAKILPDTPQPTRAGDGIKLYSARNEREAACLVLSSKAGLPGLRVSCSPLAGPGEASLPAKTIEILQAQFVNITRATDVRSKAGMWPDPLLPVTGAVDLAAGTNQVLWLRVAVPKDIPAGLYRGAVRLQAKDASAELPLSLVVFDFTLPDQMTCTTAFGFSPGEVFQYHGLKTEEQKRLVLDKYLANLAAHHISPYDPTPLDSFKVRWPDVKPPKSAWADWTGLQIVTNEVHSGKGALLINDDQPGSVTTVRYEPLIPIPPKGMKLRLWYRTAVPGHRFLVTLTHYDANKHWMSGQNNDIGFEGSGLWQEFAEDLTRFPEGAAFVQVHLRATTWTEEGERLGLVWFDDVSLTDRETGKELLPGGDFERNPRTELVAPREKLAVEFDFRDWDRAMDRAMNVYHFNSFKVDFPGLGGGTFHEIEGPSLLGFHEDDPEYELLMDSYGRQLESHLRQRGWLDKAYVYWFDEPSREQYPFVMRGFAKLKQHAPGLARMLTEQVEPGLIGGPNLWCPISNEYEHQAAQARRATGEKFWWYVCTGPKAPYTGLFIDHPAPEMRIWAWQTWQRGINGLLVWQLNYWTSSAAYPDRDKPQNPYDDPMSWTSGYSTPAGKKLPWGNGDGRFVYPPPAAAGARPSAPVLDGPVDSIRWEHLRDGIEDYEYFCILRQRLEQAKPGLAPEKYAALSKLLEVPKAVTTSLTEFTPDGAPIEAHRRALAQAIESLKPR